MKYAWIDAHRYEFDLANLCDVLDVSMSGYRAWKRGGTPDRKRLTVAQLLALIRAIHAEVKRAYGSPRMTRELRNRGFAVGETRAERIMRENSIRAWYKRRALSLRRGVMKPIVAQTRRNEAEILRVGHKNIDILAFPVTVTQHQNGAAAEGPEGFGRAMFGDFIDQRKALPNNPSQTSAWYSPSRRVRHSPVD